MLADLQRGLECFRLEAIINECDFAPNKQQPPPDKG